MKFASMKSVKAGGELGDRCAKLLRRLNGDDYSPEAVFDPPTKDWPGDWLGRCILAQTMMKAATGEEPDHLKKIIDMLPEKLNGRGYIGEIYEDAVCEQQLAGNSWLLRGLCEYSALTGDEKIKAIVNGIVNGLYLPALENLDDYPVGARGEGGGMAGNNAGQVGKWIISTDTGCVVIALDGLSAAYELTGDETAAKLAYRLANILTGFDLLAMKAQTHATLTATRGLLRLYSVDGKRETLASAKKIFDLYVEHGMTVTYENDNWFGRPEWTEPCAVIDSFICAMQLYLYTVDAGYIDLAQRIMYNGMFNEQRPSGGFGCNSCAVDGVLRCHCYEASWCCTMRGGEGLAKAAQYCYAIADDRIIIPYLTTSEADIEIGGRTVHISQTSGYPYEGKASIDIDGIGEGNTLDVVIYQPREGEYYAKRFTGEDNHLDVSFLIPLVRASPDGEKSIYLHGNLILCCDEGETPDYEHIQPRSGGVYMFGKTKMSPLGQLWKKDEETVKASAKRVLF